jgi:hypothetical protein
MSITRAFRKWFGDYEIALLCQALAAAAIFASSAAEGPVTL